ncbi:hypothetical protein BHE74_00024411 [Ensete ventricosum]|nr:hypothetical protein GW17_00012730 [Ensete ventricosum]RWW68088.1 hypothetical protein BHE74_00024411 [Ensete ventricosum]
MVEHHRSRVALISPPLLKAPHRSCEGRSRQEARVKKKNGKKTGRRERTKDTQRRRGVPADGGAGERRRGGPEAVVRDRRPRRPMALTDVVVSTDSIRAH